MPAPKGDDPGGIYQTIGYILSIEDMTSPEVTKAEDTIASVDERLQKRLEGITTKIEDFSGAGGKAFGDFAESCSSANPCVEGLENTLIGIDSTDQMTVIDDYTFQIKTKVQRPLFQRFMTFQVLGARNKAQADANATDDDP